jgi:hypothetical protein
MIPSLRSATEARKTPALPSVVVSCLLVSLVLAVPAGATVVPEQSPLSAKAYRHPDLNIPSLERAASELPGLGNETLDLVGLGVSAGQGFYDWRAGRWGSLILSQPLVPGDGMGNNLGSAQTVSESLVWQALSNYVRQHQAQLRVDTAELGQPRISINENGNIIQVHVPRVVDGITVRDSGLSAMINHGNLILLGLQNWGTLDASPSGALAVASARAVVVAHVQPFVITGYRDEGHLELIPLARGTDVANVTAGAGYNYRLAWVVSPQIKDDMGTWEALVDANNGELIAFEDKNQYAVRRVQGGVFPVSNDGRPPDGIEQALWPMPFANVTGGPFTTTGGVIPACQGGSLATTLNGQFIRITDTCGAVNETTAANDLDLATSAGTDCTVPAGHSVGDTHSARSGFYELNRIEEQARGYLLSGPANTWLTGQLTSNMNINLTCNAFWNGATVNFYRDSGSQCRNTGEIAAVFDHEWGHGLDDNGTNGNISSPGEAIADIHATMRLNDSCVGRGFFKNQVCGGYGDPCTGTPATGCTGVRDADFAHHVSGLPHGITWILSNCGGGGGPCGREVHCEGQTMSEVAWDLQFRDLRGAPFNYDANTALELATRAFYLGAETVTQWYTCAAGCNTAGTCGCGATGGYLLTLGADDDNGNIADGTPHMQAIFNAFNRHQMACNVPAVVNSGCAGAPTTAPVVVAAPTAGGVSLSWAAVPGASNYLVYRTEGVSACAFGKIKAGTTTGTTWSDTAGLLDGRLYSYGVLPAGANSSCFGLMSACASATPTPAADPCTTTNASVSFSATASTVAEAGVNATVTVRVTTNNGQVTVAPLTVNFTTVDGTANAGSDYTVTSGVLTFPTGTTSGATQNILVPINNDVVDEPNEDFLLALSNVTGGTMSPNVSHVVTIVDDDVPVELQGFVVE